MRFCVPAMACCVPSRGYIGEKEDYILDVEQILKDYVWNRFKDSRPAWQRVCIRRKDFEVHVPMNYFHFEKKDQDVRPRQKSEPTSLPQSQPSVVQGMTHQPKEVTENPLVKNCNVMTVSTDFVNNTGKDQTYHFRFEKTRKASLDVTFQKGFTIGGKVNFSLRLGQQPADGSVGGAVDLRVNVTKTNKEVVEETLTWEATSQIQVTASSVYTAKILLSEVPVSYNFKLWTKLSMPSGGAEAFVLRKNDNAFRHTVIIHDLSMVFEPYKNRVEIVPEQLNREYATYVVIFKTVGIVEGVRLSDQKIFLDGKPVKTGTESSQAPQNRLGPAHPRVNTDVMSVADVTPDGSHGDGLLVSSSRRMLALSSSAHHHPPPPPPPIIEEVPEDDGGMGESETLSRGSGSVESPASSPPAIPPSPYITTPAARALPHPQTPPPISSTVTGAPSTTGHAHQGNATTIGHAHQGNATAIGHAHQGSGAAIGHSHHGSATAIGQLPRITTTAPSSQASSPLSDAGSPDLSEGSKKSETITTV